MLFEAGRKARELEAVIVVDWAYYLKAKNYGESGYTGVKLDGVAVPDRHGGIMFCPRCNSPLTVGASQIEHIGDPCSVGHTGHRHDDVMAHARPRKCGAHWKTVGDEEVVDPATAPALVKQAIEWLGFGSELKRRGVEWHGDV